MPEGALVPEPVQTRQLNFSAGKEALWGTGRVRMGRRNGEEGRQGVRVIPFGKKEKALNLQISPAEAKPTPNQPQLGAQESVNKC